MERRSQMRPVIVDEHVQIEDERRNSSSQSARLFHAQRQREQDLKAYSKRKEKKEKVEGHL
jgi:hypothetical protein